MMSDQNIKVSPKMDDDDDRGYHVNDSSSSPHVFQRASIPSKLDPVYYKVNTTN
jgi:hypothetical protein